MVSSIDRAALVVSLLLRDSEVFAFRRWQVVVMALAIDGEFFADDPGTVQLVAMRCVFVIRDVAG